MHDAAVRGRLEAVSGTCTGALITQEAVKKLGLEPRLVIANGGLDANWLNRKGIPTVTLGAGQHNAHTLREYADIREYLLGCELGLSLATAI